MKNNTWLLVANSSTARVLSFCKPRFIQTPKSQELKLEEHYEHSQSRMKTSELIADRAGIFGNGSYVESTPPKKQEAERFAKDLVQKLKNAHQEDKDREYIIAAPPAFLGLLRKHLPAPLDNKVTVIEKDLTSLENQELASALYNHI